MIKIFYKKDIEPYFGLAFPKNKEIYIREDLPKWVQLSTIVHELYHLDDTSTNVLWREIKAISAQLFIPFIGGIMAVFMTIFSIGRIKFYINRIRGK